MFHCLFHVALLLGEAPPSQPVAMVLNVKGEVILERDKDKPRRLRTMDLLRPGDRLQASEKSEATLVFLVDGHRERLKVRKPAEVAEKGCKPDEAVWRLDVAKLSATQLNSLRELARSSRAGVGVLRGDPEVTPAVVTPMFGAAILTDRPALSWPAAAKAEGYRVQLLAGPEGKEERTLWRTETKETRLAYPEKEKPLRLGLKYRWRVTALLSEDKKMVVVHSQFSTLTRGEVEKLAGIKPLLESMDPADLLLAATTYEAHGVYGEALGLYEKLAEKAPEEANFQAALASYYARAGLAEKARAAREKARKLGVVVPEK